ncbi:MAG: Maf family protein [Blautia sp.]
MLKIEEKEFAGGIMDNIILASASPRRKELLQLAGVSFTVLPATGEEQISTAIPWEAVEHLSFQKAQMVAESHFWEEGTLVIGADTIVVYQEKILGKPKDAKDAVQTLLCLQGNTHQVYTGVTVFKKQAGQWLTNTFWECTDVTFYPVSLEEIQAYVKTGEPMDKAGSYGIQGGFRDLCKRDQGRLQ